MPLPALWQVTPLGVIAVVLCILHERGLRRLSARQTPGNRRRTRLRSILFYSGMIGVALVASGPLERWSMPWLTVHMMTHVLEMFYLPPLLVVAGSWVPFLFALPVDRRRRLLAAYYRSPGLRWLRRTGSVITNPIVAILAFNGVMVLWHVPAVYDWAAWHGWVMNWLMTPSFVIVGYLFWRVILPSHPAPPRGSTRIQLARDRGHRL